jgi:hypothetical protein
MIQPRARKDSERERTGGREGRRRRRRRRSYATISYTFSQSGVAMSPSASLKSVTDAQIGKDGGSGDGGGIFGVYSKKTPLEVLGDEYEFC